VIFSVIPILNLWAAYRIRKLRKFVLFLIAIFAITIVDSFLIPFPFSLVVDIAIYAVVVIYCMKKWTIEWNGKVSWGVREWMNEQLKKTHVGDIDIAYKIFGNAGEPILLIIGYRETMDVWNSPLLNNLASKYKVILFDNRGMGETSAGNKEFTMDLFTEDTVWLLNSLDVEKAHVLGWSMGTNIALNLAINYPSRVNKLVLYAAVCGGKGNNFRFIIESPIA
jgi:hypothetical protein